MRVKRERESLPRRRRRRRSGAKEARRRGEEKRLERASVAGILYGFLLLLAGYLSFDLSLLLLPWYCMLRCFGRLSATVWKNAFD